MAGSTHQSLNTVADELFDKYLLPKAALVVILAASLIGTVLSARLAGTGALALAVLKCSYFVSLGVLLGGLLWKHGFVRPADLGTGAAEYCAQMYDRFDRLAIAAVVILIPSTAIVLGFVYNSSRVNPLFRGVLGVLVIGLVVCTLVDVLRADPIEQRFRTVSGVAALGFAIAVVILTASAEVALVGRGLLAASVRAVHLLAFTVWVGGAVWNIFVAVPSGQAQPTVPVIRAAGEQLERFRWAVRFIIPTLVLTGIYQAVDALGTQPSTYFGTLVGQAVLTKVGLIALLMVIFLTCPMWRACSPIDGVCDLADLERSSPPAAPEEGGTDD
ncbi:hypothetical protein [Halomarina pelagica]|uniref:hypothetical protein n=1 Tax=Halomarina pelagica TaxID=2961599 RepID=UPI0020C3482F|nr:hypothetical protein [Halomarina sp. BND7]